MSLKTVEKKKAKMQQLRREADAYPNKNHPRYVAGKITWKQYQDGHRKVEDKYSKARKSYQKACDKHYGKR